MKKVVHKIVSVVMVVTLLTSAILSLNKVYAAGTYQVEILSEDTYKAGDEVLVSIKVKNLSSIGGSADGICVVTAKINYDEEKLEKISIEGKNGFSATWGGNIVIDKAEGVSNDTEIAVLKFRVKDTAELGDTSITLTSIESSNGSENIPTHNSDKIITVSATNNGNDNQNTNTNTNSNTNTNNNTTANENTNTNANSNTNTNNNNNTNQNKNTVYNSANSTNLGTSTTDNSTSNTNIPKAGNGHQKTISFSIVILIVIAVNVYRKINNLKGI